MRARARASDPQRRRRRCAFNPVAPIFFFSFILPQNVITNHDCRLLQRARIPRSWCETRHLTPFTRSIRLRDAISPVSDSIGLLIIFFSLSGRRVPIVGKLIKRSRARMKGRTNPLLFFFFQ